MHHIIKSFFYSVALLTLLWISHADPDAVTIAAWVKVVQSPYAQQAAAILTFLIETFDFVVAGLFSVPAMVTRVVGFKHVPRETR